MNRCENWTIKKAERQRTNAFKLQRWRTLESPLDSKEIKQINLEGNQHWILIAMTDADTEAPILWPPDANSWLFGTDSDAGEDWRQKEKRATEDELFGWHHQCNGHELGQTPRNGERQEGLVCHSPWGHEESDVTWQLNNSNNISLSEAEAVTESNHPRPCELG